MKFALASSVLAAAAALTSAADVSNIVVDKSADGRMLTLQYEAFDQTHIHEELHLVDSSDLYHPDISVVIQGEAGGKRTLAEAPKSRTYKKVTHQGWTIVTLSEEKDGQHSVRSTHVGMDDHMTSIEHSNGEHTIDRRHLKEASEEVAAKCQMYTVDNEESANAQIIKAPELEPEGRVLRGEKKSHNHGLLSMRALRARPEFWDGCFPSIGTEMGQSSPYYFDFGFIADLSFYQIHNDIEKTISEVESILSHAQHVYIWQVNVMIRLSQLIIVVDQIPGASRNSAEFYMGDLPVPVPGDPDATPRCTTDIQTKLTSLQPFSQNAKQVPVSQSNGDAVQQGEWHWLTNCYPIPGVVGVAIRLPTRPHSPMCSGEGNLFLNGLNVGVSSAIGAGTWLVFAHEMGHNWGLDHSFEDGQSETTGVMDYGYNIHYDYQIQFNRDKRYTEFCGELQRFTGNDSPCKKSYANFMERVDLAGTCTGKAAGAPCPIGYCDDKQKCVNIASSFTIDQKEILKYEEIEFGWVPSSFSKVRARVEGEAVEASPQKACSPLVGDYTGKWVVVDAPPIIRIGDGDCEFDLRAKNVLDAGGIGVIFYTPGINTEQLNMFRGRVAVDIPVLQVTKENADILLNGESHILSYGRPWNNDLETDMTMVGSHSTLPKSPTPTGPPVTIPPTISSASSLVSSFLLVATIFTALF